VQQEDAVKTLDTQHGAGAAITKHWHGSSRAQGQSTAS